MAELPKALEQIIREGQRRNEKVYVWLRHLILVAAGSLSVLVGLHSNQATPSLHNVGRVALKGAVGCLGTGVLLGSIALYGEVWLARQLVKNMESKYRQRAREMRHDESISATSGPLPKAFRFAECACYASLLAAVAGLVAYVSSS